jgi:membrane protease YdiL (CAAX protease family)
VLQSISQLFSKTYSDTERQSAEYMRTQGNSFQGRVFFICVYVAFSLSVIHYFADATFCSTFLKQIGFNQFALAFDHRLFSSAHAQFWRLAWWAGLICLFYLLLPMAIVLFVFKEPLSNYGFKNEGALKDIRLYFIMLCVMIPLVWYCSSTQSFQARYPFYELHKGEGLYPWFMLWELLYFMQFVALEFFFRGFVVHGLKNRFGFYSVLVMTIPYCMIHFGKPLPETIAAIIAGIVLGVLSLKSGSVFLGILIHFTVALSMDLAALAQKGFF